MSQTVKSRCKKITAAQIPTDTSYQGYFWYSDDAHPLIFHGGEVKYKKQEKTDTTFLEEVQKLQTESNPFIVEGNLYSKEKNISIQIKNIDGSPIILKFDLTDLDKIADDKFDRITYKAKSSRTGFEAYEMIEAWAAENDPDLAGMTTLKPAWAAFIGFKNPTTT